MMVIIFDFPVCVEVVEDELVMVQSVWVQSET